MCSVFRFSTIPAAIALTLSSSLSCAVLVIMTGSVPAVGVLFLDSNLVSVLFVLVPLGYV